jgi:hypothetical protein
MTIRYKTLDRTQQKTFKQHFEEEVRKVRHTALEECKSEIRGLKRESKYKSIRETLDNFIIELENLQMGLMK